MWMQLAVSFLLLGLAALTLLRFGFTIATTEGDSMSPVLATRDRLLICNLFPRLWLAKGQIVVGQFSELPLSSVLFADTPDLADPDFAIDSALDQTPLDPLEFAEEAESVCESSSSFKFIKRVIGLPGDTVCIPLATLPENLQPLLRDRCNEDGNLVWEIPKHQCFVRGDFPFSVDSVLLGTVPLSAITGIAVLKLPRPTALEPSLQQSA